MYLLMNKDRVVAEFALDKGILSDKYTLVSSDKERMPIGFKTVEQWLNNRKGSKHNEHLRKLMQMCDCEKTEGFIRVTHAATVNDTFWVKSDQEPITWNEVSLYRNQFNEVVSRLAFEGIGLYGIKISSTSPELSTEGSFRKCWKREEDGIYLYKRGQTGARNVGLEPYCEMLGAEIAGKICNSAVEYTTVMFHGELASKCKLFTNEETGYVSISRFEMDHHSPDEMLAFYARYGTEDDFRRMIVLDALTFNVDRHAGNHGVLIDNDTLAVQKMAPVFDMNLSMLPYVEMPEFQSIGEKLLEYGPRIGDDFTQMGQAVMTPEIRKDLIAMKDFTFSFQGDEKFPRERVKALEILVQKQAAALLSKERLRTKDVFVPATKELPVIPGILKETDAGLFAQDGQAVEIGEKLMATGRFSSYDRIVEEDHMDLVMHPAADPAVDIYVNMSDFSIWMEKHGLPLNLSDCTLDNPALAEGYQIVTKWIDSMDAIPQKKPELEQ